MVRCPYATTSPSLSGLGLSPHGLVDGSTVMGFFRDEGDMQDFVVIGSLFGRPSDKYKIDGADLIKKYLVLQRKDLMTLVIKIVRNLYFC